MKKLSTRVKGNIIILTIMIGSLAAWIIWSHNMQVAFYQSAINSTVVDSSDWWKRSIQYILSDGNSMYIPVYVDDRMRIGDSVSKPANSTIFKVYRRDNKSQYQFLRQYDDSKSYD